jgi:hypothetical protein
LVQKMHSSDFSPLMYWSLQGAHSRSADKAAASYIAAQRAFVGRMRIIRGHIALASRGVEGLAL